jgi:hypothetical protein
LGWQAIGGEHGVQLRRDAAPSGRWRVDLVARSDSLRAAGNQQGQAAGREATRVRKNLLARRIPQVPLGEDAWYGMGLEVDKTWGVSVVHHGGSMAGYKSDIMLLPDAGIGAVILTNAGNGGMLLRPFMRRLLEIVYDGKPEAAGDVASAATRQKANFAKERERLMIPADPVQVKALASRYISKELGGINVTTSTGVTTFDFGEWRSKVASRKNDDGTMSFVTTDPTNLGFEFVVAQREGKRALIVRDGQHEYWFIEAP